MVAKIVCDGPDAWGQVRTGAAVAALLLWPTPAAREQQLQLDAARGHVLAASICRGLSADVGLAR